MCCFGGDDDDDDDDGSGFYYPCYDHHSLDIFQGTDWSEFCHNLSNNTTLKRLAMVNQCDVDTRTFNRLGAVWRDSPNQVKIEFLELERFSISSQLFDDLCHNRYITTLILTESTLEYSLMPSFSNMLSINNTIKTLSIAANRIGSTGCKDLAMAFKANKSITVLDITENEFENDVIDELFTSLLVNDTVEYLVLDQKNCTPDHPYFTLSKSLKQYFYMNTHYSPPNFSIDGDDGNNTSLSVYSPKGV
ncbi:hypothetical protein DFA_10170 [Cavenderia fasciculata]|uniref:Leucine-rich repeat-containing protein n=1 Tax=Cavenderia fasciculata TaxID=261658 RepID=F4Q9G7_CACFS|nr:uncharacterized protein DFA_10170 [Cavenderia fasciculata]EGG15336.1 hypothetical protein DFA_10170 [Cavenderia fasciculata]|eukprot:XP_004352056.1 hypothetical protein DFA_10170 [Cavenderia fasciculata]